MARAYLRLDPRTFERKVVKQGYSLPLFAAFVALLCEAEHQPARGRFRSERVLRATLDVADRYVTELMKRGDVVAQDDGSLYVEGWDEWQEGDWKVGERVKRIRYRQRPPGPAPDPSPPDVTPDSVTDATVENVTDVTVPTVYTPSDGRRQSVIDSGSGKREKIPVAKGYKPSDEGPLPDVAPPLLTADQLAAWTSFGPEWTAFKAAWLGRGLKLPPSGGADEEGSQRATLHPIIDAFPSMVGNWVRTAPKRASGADVVGHVIRCYRDAIAGQEDDEAPEWLAPSKAEAAETLGAILGHGRVAS